ncbi:TPA: ABC transporter permease, partial [Streptococcus suis]
MKSNKEQKYFWLTFSLIVALMIWWFLSNYDRTSRSFPNIILVWNALLIMIDKGFIFEDIFSSLTSVFFGFTSGFLLSVPNALFMSWYSPYRNIVYPWIQYIRNIPPLAYVPLVVISAGVGLLPQVIVIAIATFLTMTVTI